MAKPKPCSALRLPPCFAVHSKINGKSLKKSTVNHFQKNIVQGEGTVLAIQFFRITCTRYIQMHITVPQMAVGYNPPSQISSHLSRFLDYFVKMVQRQRYVTFINKAVFQQSFSETFSQSPNFLQHSNDRH